MKMNLVPTMALGALLLGLLLAESLGGWNAGAALADTPTPVPSPAPPTATPPPPTPTAAPPTATAAPATATSVPATATPVVITITSPVINFPQALCVGAGLANVSSANVTFTWQPALGASVQFLDLSLFDNNFQDGTFISTGGLNPGQSSFTWNGLLAGQAHFWRVSALNPAGFVSSSIGSFSPCGNPVLLPITYACTGFGTAAVTFRWAPTTPPGIFTFVDLTLANNNFAAGTFLSGGPFPPTNQSLVWPGILANRLSYVRVNTFNGAFWTPSQQGTFFAAC